MRENQRGRRNLSPAWKVELELGNKADLLDIGKKAMSDKKVGNSNASDEETTLSENDKLVLPPVNTQKEIAKAAGVSTGQVGMAEHLARPRGGEKVESVLPLDKRRTDSSFGQTQN